MNDDVHFEKVTTIFVSFQKDNDGRKECTFGTIMVQNYYNDT